MRRGIGHLRAGGFWSPALLFSSGAQGTWFDPADFSTLYQDSAGTTPVTATGQPVGMLLDKSQGTALGAELVAVSFSASTGWSLVQVGTTSGVASVSGGALSLPRVDASNFAEAGLSVATVVGRTYQVRWTTGAGGAVQIRAGATVGNAAAGAANLAANTNGTFVFTATANPQVISFVPQTDASTATVTAASVKNLAGNHAVQATATARPIERQAANGAYWVDYDGVDDVLNVSFASSLGAICTVARATATGASILTGQTIGTTYADNTDHFGLVIVNRALSTDETTNITTYLNRKAGL